MLGRTTMMVLAVTLHNIPEGMAVGVMYAGLLAGNTKITVRTVIVKDTTAPVITANGKSQTLKVGDTYTELGATLTDNAYIDADDYEITIHFYDENGKLVYPSPSKVDTSKVGEYRIAYTAKDSSGNASNVATISVKVER